MKRTNLKRCPCGKVPDGFEIIGRYTYPFSSLLNVELAANCCNREIVRIAVPHQSSNKQIHQLAAKAWNELPRGEDDAKL